MIAYKLFRIKDGKLFPLYVLTEKETKINTWTDAECGIRKENGKVKSKLGDLAFRPGWHLTEFPLANHIGKRDGNELIQAKDTVWCEVEFSDTTDYTKFVEVYKKDGSVNLSKSYMQSIPVNGFYWYQTNPNAQCRWLIAGSIKVNRILTNDEIDNICLANGLIPQRRET